MSRLICERRGVGLYVFVLFEEGGYFFVEKGVSLLNRSSDEMLDVAQLF